MTVVNDDIRIGIAVDIAGQNRYTVEHIEVDILDGLEDADELAVLVAKLADIARAKILAAVRAE